MSDVLRSHRPGTCAQEDCQVCVTLRASVAGSLAEAEAENPGDRCFLNAAGWLLLWTDSSWNVQ